MRRSGSHLGEFKGKKKKQSDAKKKKWGEVGKGPLTDVVAGLPSADVVFNEHALAAVMEIKTLSDRFRWPAEICPAPPY